ncbi:flagellar hook-length control protein FliK [Desulfovibrio sp. OttesenSCG-928-F20]|nr:flagellar hook-length control protein FliK [Desulfovibrio sp. OttesenSCG-928-M16]MDL2290888.1 flagellar hook-length control protein FliK [Desulfovibrio sp. OttesenSCG-928-F20]
MQFFPVDTNSANLLTPTVETTSGDLSGNSFGSVLSSFIEEDREDYSGRPAGFSSQGVESGTISERDSQRFAEAMRSNGVDNGLVTGFEKMVASGEPVTLGTITKAFNGKGRQSEELEDNGRNAFKALLGRLGLSKDEQDELLALSDEGDIEAMTKRLGEVFGNLTDKTDMTLEELKSLLTGLDLSESARNDLLASLAGGEDISLDPEQMQGILHRARAEQSTRDNATHYAQKQLRDVIADILASKKSAELTAPVDDMRGTRRSEQSEALMQDSVRKNTNIDSLASQKEGQGLDEEQADGRKQGKTRSERILETAMDSVGGKESKEQQAPESVRLTQRIEVAVNTQTGAQTVAQPQNMNASQAMTHRQEIFSQVEHGLLQSVQNGGQRLTLQLNPSELGQLTVVLSMQQGEIRATIRAENPDAASVLREQLVELRQSLEAQGLKVKELDVQTGLQGNDFAGQWEGHQEHNLMRDSSERARLIRLTRIRRDAAHEAGLQQTAVVADEAGLHIVA